MTGVSVSQWVCQFCTYLNYSPATMCEMCDLNRPEPPPLPVKLRPPSPVRRVPALPIKPKKPASEDADSWRQKRMKEEGEKLIHLIRASQLPRLFPHEALTSTNVCSCVWQDGEKRGLSPEEVYTSMKVSEESCNLSSKWLKMELPLLLDQIRMLVATSSSQSTSERICKEDAVSVLPSSADILRSFGYPCHQFYLVLQPCETPPGGKPPTPLVQLSRAEAKQAWLTAGGDTEKAAKQALRDRLAKVTRALIVQLDSR